MNVGVIINLQNRKVLQGITRFAMAERWKLVLQSAHDLEDNANSDEWINLPVQGLLIDIVGRSTKKLAHSGLPTVNVADAFSIQSDIPTVCMDSLAIGRLAAEHLLLQPVSHFAYAGQPHRYYSEVRRQGFMQTLTQAGHRCATLISDKSREIADWVASLPKPVGIMASNDLHAARILNSCRAANIDVRERVAVIGVDDSVAICHATFPTLTSVALQGERVGWEAARMLSGMMAAVARRAPLPRPANFLVPPLTVEVRESSILHPIDADLVEALRLIREEFSKMNSVDDLADRLAVHRRTLERRFAAVLGRSPLEEIRRARITAARQLLVGSNMPIAQIARQCGYGSLKGMAQAFHQVVGSTPTAYRRAMHRNLHD
jgi:LacI family transcriptional regulator